MTSAPTRLLSTFLWEEDGPAALLWPPKRRAVRVVEEGADSQTELPRQVVWFLPARDLEANAT